MCITVQTLNGQEFEHVFKSYDVDDGMPSSQTYKIIQDKEGYIWFGSNRGLIRYNGYEFKKYTVKDGLSVNLIYHVHVDEDNTIYFVGSDYKIFYLKDNQVYEFLGNDEIIDIDANAQILSLSTDEEHLSISFWNKLGSPSYFKFKKDGELVERRTLESGLEIIDVGGKPIIHCGGFSAFSIAYGSVDTTINVGQSPDNLAYIANGKDKTYLSTRKELFVFENNRFKHLKTFDNTIYNLAVDQNEDLYVAFKSDGLFKYEKGNLNEATHLLSNQNSISILIDVNNNLWCGSDHKGLQFSTLGNFTHLKLKEKVKSLDLVGDEKQLLAIVDRDKIYDVSTNKFDEVKQEEKTYTNWVKKEHLYKYYVSGPGNSKLLNFKNKRFDICDLKSAPIYFVDYKVVNDTSLYSISRSQIILYNSEIRNLKVYYLDYRLQSFEYVNDQYFLVGTTNGVKVIDLNSNSLPYQNIEDKVDRYDVIAEPYHIVHPFFNSSISDIVVDDGTRIFTSVEQGLWIEKDSKSTWLTEDNGIISNNLEKILNQDGYIIVSSNSGLSVLDKDFNIRNYNTSNGLITNDVDGFYLRNDSLYVVSKVGISLLNLKENTSKRADLIPLILKKISVNDREWKIDSSLTLRHIYGRVAVEFEALNYIEEGEINYRYKLQGLEDTWNYTQNRNIRYTNLPAGKFKLLISHELEGEKWTEPMVLLSFRKRIPIMMHWTFIVAYVLLSIWLFIKLSNFFNRRQRIKQKNELAVLELERKALQAQMNPHFMFNSLSSLKYMIMKDKKRDSEDYLTKFSKFTRLTLNHSTEKFIPIDSEIELLNNYIDLELTRFEHKFEYKMVNNVSNSNVKIPPMLIQPFIENTIIHGFEGLEKLGLLTVVFEDYSVNTILCSVTDNGVGRKASNNFKRHKKSFGMSLVLKRLKLLHKEGNISVIDLQEGNKIMGTKVEVKIPFIV